MKPPNLLQAFLSTLPYRNIAGLDHHMSLQQLEYVVVNPKFT
jgi:hypothetical protein